jgi:isopenicillin-N N-acyltransferase-like protein
VRRSIDGYRAAFAHYAGWDWEQVLREALRFEEPIAESYPAFLEEMRGIADGAGVRQAEVLALNVRTEVMFAARAREAIAQRRRTLGECSAFCMLPNASSDGHTVIGQNWDWLLHCDETVIVLEVEQEGLPDFVTVVEAGLLAKAGMNSSGLGVVTNALVTELDKGEPGLPYHVILRAMMDCENLSDAVSVLEGGVRSSSANYLIAHADGVAIDVEAAPGSHSTLYFQYPEQGVLLHTNHFLAGEARKIDLSIWAMPDSPGRWQCLKAAVELGRKESPDGTLSLKTFQRAFSDHAGYPSSICCHPDVRENPLDTGRTVASVLMDLGERRVWIADGFPCESSYREPPLGQLLSKGSPLAASLPEPGADGASGPGVDAGQAVR